MSSTLLAALVPVVVKTMGADGRRRGLGREGRCSLAVVRWYCSRGSRETDDSPPRAVDRTVRPNSSKNCFFPCSLLPPVLTRFTTLVALTSFPERIDTALILRIRVGNIARLLLSGNHSSTCHLLPSLHHPRTQAQAPRETTRSELRNTTLAVAARRCCSSPCPTKK